MKGLVVAGTQSGVGKTTVSLGLMAALKRRGLAVQAFKVGPDFIDPGHHEIVTGRPSRNLDGWMLPAEENRRIFWSRARETQVAVVEGVMGLFDGFSVKTGEGSTAQMAKLLGLPVLLVAGGSSLAGSFAALVGGYVRFDPELTWAGVVANRTGGPGHGAILGEAMELVPETNLLGCLPKEAEISLPERHLGLITAQEGGFSEEIVDRLAGWIEANLDLDRLLAGLDELDPGEGLLEEPGPAPEGGRVRLGVARDKAFCFYYQENLDRLEAAGAELVFFSPLESDRLPEGLRGLYLGGGYPELFAEELAANKGLLSQIASLGRAGMPLYAECGGMMFLGQEMTDLEGRAWPLTGLLPIRTRMLKRLSSLGYREVELARDTVIGPRGTRSRGHEFHYSEILDSGESDQSGAGAYLVGSRKGPLPLAQGFHLHNTLASYIHLHFGSNPDLAPSFVGRCRAWKG